MIVAKSRIQRWILAVVGATLFFLGAVQAAPATFEAILVDRSGNRYDVRRLTYKDRTDLEYYVADQRHIRSFKQLDRLLFQGSANDEEQVITVELRQGGKEIGSILTGGSTVPRAAQTLGRGYTSVDFAGVSKLGPFSMRLSDVREVIFRHPQDEVFKADPVFKADLITLKGERFTISELHYMGKARFEFNENGNRFRPIAMHKIEKIDFAEVGSGEEKRPVTLTLWSGRVLQGTLNISLVRLPGETDRVYNNRRNAAFTGRTERGPFHIGAQDLRQIRFRKVEEEVTEEEVTEEEVTEEEVGEEEQETAVEAAADE